MRYIILLIFLLSSCTSTEEKAEKLREVEKQKITRQRDSIINKYNAISWSDFSKKLELREKYFFQIKEDLQRNKRIIHSNLYISDIVNATDSTYQIFSHLSSTYPVILTVDKADVSFIINNQKSENRFLMLFTIDSIKMGRYYLDNTVDFYNEEDSSDYEISVIPSYGSSYFYYATPVKIVK